MSREGIRRSARQRTETPSKQSSSLSFRALGWRGFEFGAKHPVPEATCDTKAVFIVGKVVLKVILLERLIVSGQARKHHCIRHVDL